MSAAAPARSADLAAAPPASRPRDVEELSDSVMRCVELVEELLQAGRMEPAIAVLTVAAYSWTADPELMLTLVELLRTGGAEARANRVLAETSLRFPDHPRVAALRLRFSAPEAGLESAPVDLDSLRRAYEAAPLSRPAVLEYARMLRTLGRRVHFCDVLLPYMTKHPDDEEMRNFAKEPFAA